LPKSWKTRNNPSDPRYGEHFEGKEHEYHGLPARAGKVPNDRVSGVRERSLIVTIPEHSTRYSISSMSVDKIHPTKETNPEKVEHFREAIKRGENLSPILVHVTPSGRKECIDGHNRLEAYEKEGIKNIPVIENSIGSIFASIGKGVASVAHGTYSGVKEGIEKSRIESKGRRLKNLQQLANSPDAGTRREAIKKIREEFPEEMEEAEKG
jgi:hypothetical protein